MADAPAVSSRTREHQSNASTMLQKEIDEALDDFMMVLDTIAVKYAK